jgi:hypothetical protein
MSKHFLVVNPSLSYFAFAQRITQKQYDQFIADHQKIEGVLEEVVIVPYTQQLHRTLKAQKSVYYSQQNYVPYLYLN